MPFLFGIREAVILAAFCVISGYGLAIFAGIICVRRKPIIGIYGPAFEFVAYFVGQAVGLFVVGFVAVFAIVLVWSL